jgi:dTDP-4-amino-4,6-dideoxygalactose transaminase
MGGGKVNRLMLKGEPQPPARVPLADDGAPGRLPLVDLRAQYQSIREDIWSAIERVLERQVFLSGPETEAFESEFADFSSAPACVALSNGTVALELTLAALGIGPGDEVVTVSHTFVATVAAISRTGAKPVLVDVDEESWTMSPQMVADAVGPRTKAIIPVHIYGHPADIPAIAAAAPGVPIVEDAAQAHGALYYGRPVGSDSIAATFSFFPGKNLGAYGDAGAVITPDEELAARIRALRDHGRAGGKYVHRTVGTNARIDELQAAVLRTKLPHLRTWTRARQRVAAVYEEELDLPGFQFQTVQPWADHARHLFVILHPRRNDLLDAMRRCGIDAGVHYPIPVHRQEAFQANNSQVPREGLAVTDRLAERCLSLPLYAELDAAGVRRVVEAVRSAGHGLAQPVTT